MRNLTDHRRKKERKKRKKIFNTLCFYICEGLLQCWSEVTRRAIVLHSDQKNRSVRNSRGFAQLVHLSPPSLFFFFSFTATFWLLHSRTYISAEQTTFSKCFYEYRSSSVRYDDALLWFSSDPISMFKVSFSILISCIIQSISILPYLFALYYRWASTNLWWSSFSCLIVLPLASKIKKSPYA